MACYLITFDVLSLQTREKLESQIREIDSRCWNGLSHVWMIKSDLSGLAVRSKLRLVSEETDKIIVVLLAGWAIWHGFDGDAEAWLLKHL